MRTYRTVSCALCAAVIPFAAGCGGGERQDKNEKAGTYTVDVVHATFPKVQSLAKKSELTITVRNAGQESIPDLAVTIGENQNGTYTSGFTKRSAQANLADPERPVWIVDQGPKGGDTAYVGTWALGQLPAGQSRTFTWRVTAVQPGTHTVKYRVAAGLDGKAKASAADGGAPAGSFTVDISDAPAQSHVDPETGAVVRDSDG